ncbi:MAG: hypothetical protein AAGG81_06000 [Chlamydiota bacterium]
MFKKYFSVTDRGSLAVMLVTLVLFIAALFVKGMKHDILLETGIFLVSVKLIITGYKLTVATGEIQGTVDEILDLLKKHADEQSKEKE